jgi:hypothetical protein
MLTVKRVQGSGQYCAKINDGLYSTFVYGSSPSNALFRLERHTGLSGYFRPVVAEISRRLREWELSYAELHAGINTGTIVLPVSR